MSKSSTEEDDRLLEYFVDFEAKKFDDLDTSLCVIMGYVKKGTNFNHKNIFENIPIFEIDGWVRPKKKVIKIPYPGIPYVVMSAKWGGKIRGVVKNQKDLNPKTHKEFPNQVTVDIVISESVTANIFIFNDCLKITGCRTNSDIISTFIVLKAYLLNLIKDGHKICDESIVLTDLHSVTTNIPFKLGFKIKKDIFHSKVQKLENRDGKYHGVFSSYDPENDDVVSIMYPMGLAKAKGGDRMFKFRIQHTGSVLFIGNNRDSMRSVYENFIELIKFLEKDIRFY